MKRMFKGRPVRRTTKVGDKVRVLFEDKAEPRTVVVPLGEFLGSRTCADKQGRRPLR